MGAVDLAHEAAEDFAWAHFDEVGGLLRDEEADGVDPADSACDLADEGFAELMGIGDERRIDIHHDGDTGRCEGKGAEQLGEAILRRLHEGAVEGRADLEHDDAPGATLFAYFGGALDGGSCAGDDGLQGRIEIGGGDDVARFGGGIGAGAGGVFRAEAEDGGHGALAGGNGFLHEAAAMADGAHGVGEGDGASGDVGGVFAEGVAGDEGGRNSIFREDAQGGDGDGTDGGLLKFGEFELVFGAFKAEFGDGEAEGFVGFFEGAARDGKFSG